MTGVARAFLLGLLTAAFEGQALDVSLPAQEIARLIDDMGNPRLTVARRYDAVARLRSFQTNEPIPHLIRSLSDNRIFDPEWEPPSGPPDGNTIPLSVGRECRSLLLYSFLQVSVKNGRAYRVSDWPGWWRERRGMTLEEIRREVRDVERSRGIERD